MDDLDQLLGRRDSAKCCNTNGFLLYALEELTRELEIDVGLEKDTPDLAEPFLDVGFAEGSASAQAGKCGF